MSTTCTKYKCFNERVVSHSLDTSGSSDEMSWCMDSSCLQPSTGTAGATFQAALQFFAAQQCLIPEQWPSYTLKDSDSFDFIVVGAGSAGATLAARLAEVPQWRVLLVEAGDSPPVESIVPAYDSSFYASVKSTYDWNYTTVDRSYSYISGRMLGGSSSINGMVYIRGNPADYNLWAAKGSEGWDWESVLPYFKKTEHMTDETIRRSPHNSELHSYKGPLLVSRYESFNEFNHNTIKSFQEIGFPKILENNGPTQLGITVPHVTVYNGTRQSTVKAFLLNREQNLFIAKNTFATKVLLDETNKKAVGVELLTEDERIIKVFASREILLSAGVIGSPKILLLSGIGPKEDLENIGIPIIADLPVGENFVDHTSVSIYLTGTKKAVSDAGNNFDKILYLYNGTGTLSRSLRHLIVGFFKADMHFDYGRPDYEVYNSYLPAGTRDISGCNASDTICISIAEYNKNHDLHWLAITHLHPKSRGKVSLKSKIPNDTPLIYTGIFTKDDDIELLASGIEKFKSLVDTSYYRSMNSEIAQLDIKECNHLEFQSHEYWKCYASTLGNVYLHGTGTCSMGPDGVVDAEGKVRGISGLRVADMSIVPVTISGNTNVPAIMIGEKIADLLKATYTN